MIFRGIFQQTSVELRSGITHKSIIFLSKMPLECFTILRHKLKKPNPSFFQGIRLLFYVPEVIRTPDLPVRYQPYVSKIKLDKRHFSGTPLRVISRRGEFSYNITSHKFPQENNIIYFLNGIEKILPLLNRILLADIGCQQLIFKFCNLTTRLFNLKIM